jgi:hypothetical protein
MTIENPEVIDFVAQAPDGRVMLVVSNHLEWSDPRLPSLLEQKLRNYVAFITTGQLASQYPEVARHPVTIRVSSMHRPDGPGVGYLHQVRNRLAGLGIGFEADDMRGGWELR